MRSLRVSLIALCAVVFFAGHSYAHHEGYPNTPRETLEIVMLTPRLIN